MGASTVFEASYKRPPFLALWVAINKRFMVYVVSSSQNNFHTADYQELQKTLNLAMDPNFRITAPPTSLFCCPTHPLLLMNSKNLTVI